MLQSVELGSNRVVEAEMAAKSDKSNDPTIRCPIDTGKAAEQLTHYQFVGTFYCVFVLRS